MPRRAKILNAKQVGALKHPGGKSYPVKVAVGGVAGLYVQIQPSHEKSWILRTRFGDWTETRLKDGTIQKGRKKREFGLGGLQLVSLSEARERARELLKKIEAGIDPVAERRAAEANLVTFSGAIQKVHDEIGQGWKDKARAQFLSRAETHAKPHLGAMRVNEIEAHHVIDALSPIWIAKPATAKKVRNDIMQVLDFAKSRGWRLSPVPTSREISKGLPRQPKAKHHKAMPYAEIPAWFEAEAGKNDSPARLALMFAVLTGARSGEVRGATWAQINTEREEWVRSADDMKSDRAHTVALNKAAMAVLKRAEAFSGDKGHIFPNSRGTSLSDAALSKLLRMSKRTETVHGFRSSLRDFAAEKLPHIPDRVAEAALAHSMGDRTVQAYLRSDFIDMRRQLMEAWGQHVAPSLAGEAGNVVQMQVAG